MSDRIPSNPPRPTLPTAAGGVAASPSVTPAARAEATAEVAPPRAASDFGSKAPAPGLAPAGAPVTGPVSNDALWGPPALTALTRAMATERAPELTKTLARAAKESPGVYRQALRETLERLLKDASRLQRHLTLLDENGDGQVSLTESYDSLRALGFGTAKAAAIAGASQLALLATTRTSLGTTIPVKNADAGRHTTVDTGAMDPAQNLEAKLDELMAHDADHDGALTFAEVCTLLDERAAKSKSNAVATALVKAANKGEFQALFELTGGKLTRDDLKDFFTGSLFFSLLQPDALAQRLVLLRGG